MSTNCPLFVQPLWLMKRHTICGTGFSAGSAGYVAEWSIYTLRGFE
jgi:hypothetical protein